MRFKFFNEQALSYEPNLEERAEAAQAMREFMRSEGFRALAYKLAVAVHSNTNALNLLRDDRVEECKIAASDNRFAQWLETAMLSIIENGKED